MFPDISVIIPTYNRSAMLLRALESVRRQTLPPTEIIVVDDGSTDDTAKVITREFPEVQYIHQENSGVSSARNTGINAARGEWIAFLDSDDEWLPTKLGEQVKALHHQPEYRISHTAEIWIRHGRQVNPMKKHRKYGGYIFQQCLPLCIISPSSVIIHRSVFQEVGMFDESLPACEDYDLWLRICARYPVLYIEKPLIVKYGGHLDQLSRRFWGMDRFRIYALANIITSGILNEADEKAAVRTLIEKTTIYINGAQKRGRQEEVEKYRRLLQQFIIEH